MCIPSRVLLWGAAIQFHKFPDKSCGPIDALFKYRRRKMSESPVFSSSNGTGDYHCTMNFVNINLTLR